MKIGIVNEELGEYKNCDDYLSDNRNVGGSPLDENGTCVYHGLGCKFVDKLHGIIHNHVSLKLLPHKVNFNTIYFTLGLLRIS